ncbi:MAG: hybrid sensor histidine kinase/response regulator [SAR324 cluster bacterium]|uniref:histidine kinase n=1 Tax=SAR324 cluster bacterium TaxID=2024889 RepID=A0A7X9FU50_9DELT|nr:hybrid sensor histidine kinase/response regulator [SAR324 cluster bacterium]
MVQQHSDEKPSILVVDDNPLIVNVVSSLLKSLEFEVFSSENGKHALEILEKHAVDVIICDIMMPQMDGYQLHNEVRNRPEYSHIPFLFLTALGEEQDIYQGKELGADDYLVKPFDPKELISVVKGKVARSRKLKDLSEERFEQYRKRIIHTLSHEFRTPLVAINTGAELLLEQKQSSIDDKTVNLLEAIQRGGQRLERLVNDFMVLQQIEAGIPANMFASKKRICLLGRVAELALATAEDVLKREGFELYFENLAKDLKIEVYEPHILDVLDRIIHNARKFSPERKCIEVCVFKLEDEGIIEVRDKGIGIDPERIKEAIGVFGQLDRDKIEQQGSGLGLAICSRLLKINKGRLEFEKREGGGSKILVALPILKSH